MIYCLNYHYRVHTNEIMYINSENSLQVHNLPFSFTMKVLDSRIIASYVVLWRKILQVDSDQKDLTFPQCLEVLLRCLAFRTTSSVVVPIISLAILKATLL